MFGRVTDQQGAAVFPASIAIPGTPYGTVSNEDGRFELEIPASEPVSIIISFLGYTQAKVSIELDPGESLEINRVLEQTSQDLDEVTVREQFDRNTTITRIDIKTLDMLPTVSGNIESHPVYPARSIQPK